MRQTELLISVMSGEMACMEPVARRIESFARRFECRKMTAIRNLGKAGVGRRRRKRQAIGRI